MPKPHTFPILLDDLKTVSISFLSKHGYLKPNQWQNGTVTWSRNGKKTGSISIRVNTQPENAYLELDYRTNEVPVKYKVQLVSAPSNLGKGVVWHLLCPDTGKPCRKLYLFQGRFVSRYAIPDAMYDKQTYSKQRRELDLFFGHDNLNEELNKPFFKRFYDGKVTKRYRRLLAKQERLNSLSIEGAKLFGKYL